MSNETHDEARMDVDNLYREDVYTDRKVGMIRVLVPVTATGETDASRPTLYVGQASLYTPGGALPLSFELDAANLAEAVEKFPEAAQRAVDDTMRQLQEMRREAASSLVIPGSGQGGLGGGGGIQMP